MTQFTNAAPQVGFGEAISICFKKYVDFTGRARRSEYWWWTLFEILLMLAVSWIPFVNVIVYLGIILPTWAVTVRRLHDTSRSGWWLLAPLGVTFLGGLFMFVGVLSGMDGVGDGFGALFIVGCVVYLAAFILDIILLVWCIQDSKPETNQYGPSPKYAEEELA